MPPGSIYIRKEVIIMMRLLPIVKINNKYYFNDIRLHQYRNIINPYDYIEYSECADVVEEITDYIDLEESKRKEVTK